ncbi:MAG TPA: hypothetical protein VMY43_12160 [Methanothrix sp.]|nr:hypothetical protein [Methanothrix sp.]
MLGILGFESRAAILLHLIVSVRPFFASGGAPRARACLRAFVCGRGRPVRQNEVGARQTVMKNPSIAAYRWFGSSCCPNPSPLMRAGLA